MKVSRKIIILGGFVALILFSINVSAETINDNQGDIFHYKFTEGSWSWQAFTGDKPALDITQATYSISGSEATVTFTTVGNIESSESVAYSFFLTPSEDDLGYTIMYMNGNGMVLGGNFEGGGMVQLENPVSGNVFTATFDIVDTDATYELHGFSVEYTNPSDTEGESWQDWIPGSYAPWYTDGDTTGDDDDDTTGDDDDDDDDNGGGGSGTPGTPGFETVAILAALAIAFILFRRKH